MNHNLNILLVGKNGLLGSEFFRIFEKGFTSIGKIPHQYANANIIATSSSELDVTDNVAVSTFVDNISPDLIINCVALANADTCETEYGLAMKLNVIACKNLALAAEKCDAKIIHISTDYVFSGDTDKPYTEYDSAQPLNIYGKSKLLGEQYIRETCKKSFIVRTSWLYGHQGTNFLKTIINLANQKESIIVVNDQFGNPTNAIDLVHNILRIGVTENYGLYHISGQGVCSWFDFATEIIKIKNIKCKVIPCTTAEFPRPANRPSYSALNNLMISSTIGNEMREWKKALYDFLKE